MTNDSVVGDTHDAELRLERRKRIIGDFRTRCGDHGEQRRFSGIRNADDSAIGQQSKLEPKRESFARLTAFGKARRLAHARCEVLIA